MSTPCFHGTLVLTAHRDAFGETGAAYRYPDSRVSDEAVERWVDRLLVQSAFATEPFTVEVAPGLVERLASAYAADAARLGHKGASVVFVARQEGEL